MARLTDKVTLITGGAGGIGQAAARQFTIEGGRVVLVDLDEAALQSAVQSIGEDMASYVVADVTQPEQVQSYINAAVERWGGIDVRPMGGLGVRTAWLNLMVEVSRHYETIVCAGQNRRSPNSTACVLSPTRPWVREPRRVSIRDSAKSHEHQQRKGVRQAERWQNVRGQRDPHLIYNA